MDRTPPTAAMLRTTIAPTMLEGSSKENTLPARARAVLNVRVHPADRIVDVLRHLEQVIDNPRVRIATRPSTVSEASPMTPTDDAVFDVVRRSILESFPDAVVAPGLVLGATDSRHYSRLTDRIYRFVPVTMRPEDTVRLHGTNERVGVEDYGRAVAFYARMIRHTAGP
jgi:carboxypeptidase PM20D1